MADPSTAQLVAAARRRLGAASGALAANAGAAPPVALAPGRINLIGEHLDYNDGSTLPMAIDRRVAVAFRSRPDGLLRAHAAAFDGTCAAQLADLEPGRSPAPPPEGPSGSGADRWFAYVAGVAWAMREAGLPVGGADLAIESDLPISAGLASSAALETAVARALWSLTGIPWDPPRAAALCHRAENLYAGMPCGPMDQIAAACGEAGHALLLDCRTLDFTPVPVPADGVFVIMNTGVSRELASSAYAERRASCEETVRRVRARLSRGDPARAAGIRALRDIGPGLLERSREALRARESGAEDGERLYRRALFVVEEMRRPAALAEALHGGDLAAAGRLLDASHAGLRDLYEVSCPELDLVTGLARGRPECFGARLTGAGFGGCAIALVRADSAAAFCAAVGAAYRERTGLAGGLFVARPAAGAALAD